LTLPSKMPSSATRSKTTNFNGPEMFTFPPVFARKDSCHTFSSVLMVDDRNLTNDDFHEALFFDRSPNKTKSKMKKQRKTHKSSDDIINDHEVQNFAKMEEPSSSQPSHIFAH